MVGEIRDRETAQIAVEAALTGHLMLSTLHTNDASIAAARPIDMGVEPLLIASGIECVVAQRLARRLCEACKRPANVTAAELAEIGAATNGKKFEATSRSAASSATAAATGAGSGCMRCGCSPTRSAI
jgi:type IV pilus assembly protein PilB